MPTSRTRASVVLTLLASPLTAQVGELEPNCLPIGDTLFPLLDGSFTRTEELELNRDDRSDVAVLVGSTPVISFSPGIYEALKSMPEPAVSFAALHGSGPDGADALALTSARPGLEKWTLDLASGTFQKTTLSPSGWAGVTELAAADLDGDGAEDVVGLTANQQSVIYLLAPLAIPQFVSLGETLWRMTPIEWDGTSGSEIALITSAGIRVIERSGASLAFVPTFGGANDRFCAVRTPQPYDRLTTLVRQPNGFYQLFTKDSVGMDSLTPMGAISPVAIVEGVFDVDGFGDVCISHQTSAQLVYFENQLGHGQSSFSWASGAYALWDPTSDGTGSAPAPENEAHPLMCDLDQDGDGDVAFPLQKERALMMMRNRARDHIAQAPSVQSGLYTYSHETESGSLELTLAAPEMPPREDDKLQIVVWRQSMLVYDQPVETAAIYDALPDVTGWPMTVSIPLQEPLETLTLFHIELRMADFVDGAVASRAATAVWTFTTSDISKGHMTEYYDVPPEDILEVPIDDGDGDGDAEFAAGSNGWTGPMPCIPCFSDEEIPDPGT